jgi:ribosomal protein S18 acetylase RimI-like enzyme
LRSSDQRSYTNSMTKPVAYTPRHSLKVRLLEADDVASYRELRLEGLKGYSEAFPRRGKSWEYEATKPVSWWTERLEMNTVFRGWVDRSPLVGVAGLRVHGEVKLRHKSVLWGMYVRPKARGRGLAAALVQQVVEHARTLVEEICLSVVASNAAACRLYRAAGFQEYGLERRAIKVGSVPALAGRPSSTLDRYQRAQADKV